MNIPIVEYPRKTHKPYMASVSYFVPHTIVRCPVKSPEVIKRYFRMVGHSMVWRDNPDPDDPRLVLSGEIERVGWGIEAQMVNVWRNANAVETA